MTDNLKRKRIAIDARFASDGSGLGRYARKLLEFVIRHGQHYDYVVLVNQGEEGVVNFPEKNYIIEGIPYRHYSFNEQVNYLFFLNKQKFDLVHFTNFNHPIFYRGKFVVTIHDLTLMFYPGRIRRFWLGPSVIQWAYRKTMESAVKNSAKVIAITQYTKNDIIKYLHGDPAKIEVVLEAADEKFKPLSDRDFVERVKNNYNLDRPYFLFVSNLRVHKNIERMVAAFEKVRDEGLDVKLMIVGQEDKRYPEAMRAIEASKYREYIVVPGFVPDEETAALYTDAIAYVFPTLYEGFGLGALEAMACDLPVISSNASCLPEVLEDSVLYFDPYNVDDIVRAMKQIATDENLRQELIIKGRSQFNKYSWDKMGREIVGVYDRILRDQDV